MYNTFERPQSFTEKRNVEIVNQEYIVLVALHVAVYN